MAISVKCLWLPVDSCSGVYRLNVHFLHQRRLFTGCCCGQLARWVKATFMDAKWAQFVFCVLWSCCLDTPHPATVIRSSKKVPHFSVKISLIVQWRAITTHGQMYYCQMIQKNIILNIVFTCFRMWKTIAKNAAKQAYGLGSSSREFSFFRSLGLSLPAFK